MSDAERTVLEAELDSLAVSLSLAATAGIFQLPPHEDPAEEGDAVEELVGLS